MLGGGPGGPRASLTCWRCRGRHSPLPNRRTWCAAPSPLRGPPRRCPCHPRAGGHATAASAVLGSGAWDWSPPVAPSGTLDSTVIIIALAGIVNMYRIFSNRLRSQAIFTPSLFCLPAGARNQPKCQPRRFQTCKFIRQTKYEAQKTIADPDKRDDRPGHLMVPEGPPQQARHKLLHSHIGRRSLSGIALSIAAAKESTRVARLNRQG